MKDVYNKILKEAIDIMDFDSWDNTEQVFKKSIKDELKNSDPYVIIRWFNKNYNVRVNDPGGIYTLKRIVSDPENVTEWLNEHPNWKAVWEKRRTSNTKDIMKYIIASVLIKYGKDLFFEADDAQLSSVGEEVTDAINNCKCFSFAGKWKYLTCKTLDDYASWGLRQYGNRDMIIWYNWVPLWIHIIKN